jgi:ubiquinone biosynthesis protein
MLAAGSVPVNGVILTLLVLVTSIALVAALAWASRRLLGLPVGALRALIAGLLGFAAAEILVRTLRPVESGHVAAFLTVVLGVPLIVAMIFIVAAEALVPSGTVPQPVDVVLGARRALARSRRYSQISRIAVRHGLGPTSADGGAAKTRPAGGPRSRGRCGRPWKRAGSRSSSWAS